MVTLVNGNKAFVSVKCEEFLEHIEKYRILKSVVFFAEEVQVVAICRVILHIQKKKLESYIFKHQILKPA